MPLDWSEWNGTLFGYWHMKAEERRMENTSMAGIEVSCVELCDGDKLRGYAIFFSGGWDAYVVDGKHSLIRVGTNYLDSHGALKAVRAGYDWRKRDRMTAGGEP